MHRGRRLQRGSRGLAAVELAIALPMLTMLLFGIVEFGFMFRATSQLHTAGRECARAAAAGDAPSLITSRLTETLGGLDPDRLTSVFEYRIYSTSTGWGSWTTLGTNGTLNNAPRESQTRVTLEYDYPLIMRGLFASMADDPQSGTKLLRCQITMNRE